MERPVTSKSRGICRYYNTQRGCFAGNKCKFLHGEHEKLTPFDKNKTCRYFAAGASLTSTIAPSAYSILQVIAKGVKSVGSDMFSLPT